MTLTRKSHLIWITLAVLAIAGCNGQKPQLLQSCPGKFSVTQAKATLTQNAASAITFRAGGRCTLDYYADSKKRTESFAIKLWISPPDNIYMQGDIAFNARGLIIGSNSRQFWLAIEPEIDSYYWGTWSDSLPANGLLISPKSLLEALGAGSPLTNHQNLNYELEKQPPYDVIIATGPAERLVKKTYIYNCNYRPVRIEYFDSNGDLAAVARLSDYQNVTSDYAVPTVIELTAAKAITTESPVEMAIKLKWLKPVDLSKKQTEYLFNKPATNKYENVYRIIDRQVFKQQ